MKTLDTPAIDRAIEMLFNCDDYDCCEDRCADCCDKIMNNARVELDNLKKSLAQLITTVDFIHRATTKGLSVYETTKIHEMTREVLDGD